MRITSVLILAAFLFSAQGLNGQTVPSGRILSSNLLKWEDFTGKVDSTSAYGAKIYCAAYYTYKWRSHADTAEVDMQVYPLFGDSSWVKEDKKSPEMLKHEQGHYNLALIFADAFKKTIDTTTFFVRDCDEKIKAIYSLLLDKYSALQLQYDEETNHMLNKKKQKMWEEKINKLLAGTTE